MPGAGRTREVSWAEKENAHKFVRQGRNRTAFPAQWLTAYSALSPEFRAF